MKIAPSLLASKPEKYVEDVKILEKANVEWFHIDMLDGTFTDTYAFPVEHLQMINRASDFPMDVHLMTNNPRKISKLKKEGIKVSSRVPIVTVQNAHSSSYLETKIKRMGHIINESR